MINGWAGIYVSEQKLVHEVDLVQFAANWVKKKERAWFGVKATSWVESSLRIILSGKAIQRPRF